jgi:hydroxymethylpyrimidine/phosphomethylpyrimidine kinase
VASAIEELDLPLAVVDPVMVSSSGDRLLDDDGIQALGLELLPLARVVTPNIPEAEVLSGCRITSLADRRRAAVRIHELGARAVIITGGHAGDASGRPGSEAVVDLLFDGTTFSELSTPRAASGEHGVHGTGCAFASALAAALALGDPLEVAAARAQQYVAGAIAHSFAIGQGAPVLDYFWQRASG